MLPSVFRREADRLRAALALRDCGVAQRDGGRTATFGGGAPPLEALLGFWVCVCRGVWGARIAARSEEGCCCCRVVPLRSPGTGAAARAPIPGVRRPASKGLGSGVPRRPGCNEEADPTIGVAAVPTTRDDHELVV